MRCTRIRISIRPHQFLEHAEHEDGEGGDHADEQIAA